MATYYIDETTPAILSRQQANINAGMDSMLQSLEAAYDRDLQAQRLEQSRAYNEWLMGRDDARAAEAEKARQFSRVTALRVEDDRARAVNEQQRLITARSYHIQEENNRRFQVHFNDALALIDDARADGARHVRALKDAGIPNPIWNGVDSFQSFKKENPSVTTSIINLPEVSDAVDGYLLHLLAIESGKNSLLAMQPHGATIKNGVWKFFPKHDLRDFYFSEWGRKGKGRDAPVNIPTNISAQIEEVQEQVGPQVLAGQPEALAPAAVAPAPAAVVDPGPSPLDVYREQYDAGARDGDPAFGPDRATERRNQFRNFIGLPDLEPETRYTGPALAPTQTGTGVYEPVMTSPDAIGPTIMPVMRTVPDDITMSSPGGAEGYEVVRPTYDDALMPYISQSPYYDRWRESQAPEEVVVTDEELPWDAAHPAGPLEGQPIYPEIWQPETGEGYPQGLMPQQGYDVPMQAVPVMAPDVLPTEYPPVEGQFAYTGAPSALGGIELEEGYGRDAYMPTSEEWDAAHAPPPQVPVIPEMRAYKKPTYNPPALWGLVPGGTPAAGIVSKAKDLWGGIKDFNEKYIGFNPNIGGRMPSDVEWDESGVPETGKTVWDLGLVLSALYGGAGPGLLKITQSAPAVIRFKLDSIIKSIKAGKRSIDEIRKVDHPRIWKILKSIPGTAQRSRSAASKKGAETAAILKKEAEDILKAAKEAYDAGAFPTGGVLK